MQWLTTQTTGNVVSTPEGASTPLQAVSMLTSRVKEGLSKFSVPWIEYPKFITCSGCLNIAEVNPLLFGWTCVCCRHENHYDLDLCIECAVPRSRDTDHYNLACPTCCANNSVPTNELANVLRTKLIETEHRAKELLDQPKMFHCTVCNGSVQFIKQEVVLCPHCMHMTKIPGSILHDTINSVTNHVSKLSKCVIHGFSRHSTIDCPKCMFPVRLTGIEQPCVDIHCLRCAHSFRLSFEDTDEDIQAI